MKEKIDKRKIITIGIIILIIIGISIYMFFNNEEQENIIEEVNIEDNNSLQNEIEESKEEKTKIIIDISGEVNSPGVITLEEGARIIDAINAAGGTTKNANLVKVNLAYILADAQKIYIPSIKDKESTEYVIQENSGTEINQNTKNSKQEKININTAGQEELEKLPGVGASTATKIINYRKENGKFNKIEDIKNVSGIGESKYNNIKNYIYVK